MGVLFEGRLCGRLFLGSSPTSELLVSFPKFPTCHHTHPWLPIASGLRTGEAGVAAGLPRPIGLRILVVAPALPAQTPKVSQHTLKHMGLPFFFLMGIQLVWVIFVGIPFVAALPLVGCTGTLQEHLAPAQAAPSQNCMRDPDSPSSSRGGKDVKLETQRGSIPTVSKLSGFSFGQPNKYVSDLLRALSRTQEESSGEVPAGHLNFLFTRSVILVVSRYGFAHLKGSGKRDPRGSWAKMPRFERGPTPPHSGCEAFAKWRSSVFPLVKPVTRNASNQKKLPPVKPSKNLCLPTIVVHLHKPPGKDEKDMSSFEIDPLQNLGKSYMFLSANESSNW